MPAHPAREAGRSTGSFRRLAVVLSGGGALGAYQAGVLRVLEAVGIRPAIVVGLSVGAINAVAWVANGFRVTALERAWLRISPASIGMRWTSLFARLLGLVLVAIAALQVVLTILGSPEIGIGTMLRRVPGSAGLPSLVLDVLAWVVLGAVGFVIAGAAREIEDALARSSTQIPAATLRTWFGRALLAGAALHVAAWVFGWPWPHRFSATALVLGGMVWTLERGGRSGDWLHDLLVRLLPESGGRGLWRGLSRQRLLERLVAEGDPARLTDGSVHLMVNAMALDTGRMCYFLNWPDPSREFRDALARDLADLEVVTKPEQVIRAATASSAIPILFRPVTIGGRDFVDAGMFSSHALHAAIADGADALLVVLMSPAMFPRGGAAERHMFEVGGWLLEVGNWRDLRTELHTLPPPWSRDGQPARVCVVEPHDPLPGRMLRFDPADAAELMRRGEEDAWEALGRAGWVAGRPAMRSHATARG